MSIKIKSENLLILESLNQEITGSPFIRKFLALTYTPLTPTQINIIELVLSYQLNGKIFFMTRKNMGILINSTEGNVKKEVCYIRNELKLFEGKQKHFAKQSGSTSPLSVNIDELRKYIEKYKPSTKEPAPTEPVEATLPVSVEVTTEPLQLPEATPTPPVLMNIPKENSPTTVEPIIYEDFNVVKTLKKYTTDITLIDRIDKDYILHRTKKNLLYSKLDDLATFLHINYVEKEPIVYDIVASIVEDLRSIGKLEPYKAA